MTDQEQNSNQKISRHAKLPQHGFAAVRPHIQALADLAVASTKERIAEQLGVAAKGRFVGKLAAAGYYGLIERTDDGRYQPTERGRALTSGDAGDQLRAKREGVMSTNFGPVLYLLRSQEPKEKVIAARLQDDVGIPAGSADAVAKMLVSVSKEAELIGENGRFSAAAIEDAHAAVKSNGGPPEETAPSPAPRSKPESPAAKRATSEPPSRTRKRVNGSAAAAVDGAGGQTAPLALAPVQVVFNVDTSKLSAQEIADLVLALRSPPGTDF